MRYISISFNLFPAKSDLPFLRVTVVRKTHILNEDEVFKIKKKNLFPILICPDLFIHHGKGVRAER